MLDISQIKERINCVEYAQRNGVPIRFSGDRCVSPIRQGAKNKTSFIVFNDHFYDFGSGFGGDVIDLAAAITFNGDKGKAIRELAKITGVTDVSESVDWVNYTQSLCGEIQKYHEALTEEDREYLHRRRIEDDYIARLKIGRTNEGRLCIPYWKNGYICYYATRAMPGCRDQDKKYKKMPIDDFNEHCIWGLHTLNRPEERDLLVIAEGAFDAMSFDREGYAVISAITGIFPNSQVPGVLAIAKSFKKVFMVYDNDVRTRAGEKFTLKMAKILTENRIPCIVGKVPPQYKDVSEYYADRGDLSKLIENAVDSVEFLASKITDFDEFSDFAHDVCRFMAAPKVDIFFKTVSKSDTFDEDALKTLCKECKKAPSDEMIVKDVLKNHKLLYDPRISFFEYNGKFWEMKSDTEIEQYISDYLSVYVTGPRLSSALRVIKSNVVTTELFNMNPVINFINGTLDLLDEEPFFNFREHREADYCTYCLEYPYIPDVACHEWTNFIDTVTDSDGRRKSFLQEFAGYIMYPDNRIHKAAVLVGEGANGKSIYFKTIGNLFGETNVQHIEASELSDKFQAINLQGALLNISDEVKNDLTPSEAMIKKLVSGDAISGCHKGKPFVTFVPRTKLIISLNNYPKISDMSDGLTRRLAFVNFPLKFVECPHAENERLVDRTLEEKFAENSHLSGIFNWALEGYVMVRRCGYLTETDEHETALENFKAESDPTITFVQEMQIVNKVTYAKVYQMYRNWCEDNGYKPGTSRSSLRLISKHIKTYRKDIQPYMNNGVRGFVSSG